jgi:CHAT domain-containing protein
VAVLVPLGRAREALPYAERALKLRTEVLGERHPDTLMSLANYAVVLEFLSRPGEALPYERRALQLRTEVLGERHHDTLQSLNNYASVLDSLGRAREALPYYERYVSGVEFLRADAGREGAATQQSILASYILGYHNYLSALRSAERLPDAFNLSERTKARTLLEEINYKSAAAAADLPKAEAQHLESLQQQIADLDTSISKAAKDSEREALKSERNAASRELGERRARLQKQYPKYRQLTAVQLATVADAKLLPADSLFISFVVMSEQYVVALTLTRREVRWVNVAQLPALADTVEALRLWSANLTQRDIRDDAGQLVRIVRWSEGGAPRWRAVAQGRGCTKEDLESGRSRSERTRQPSRGSIDPNAAVTDASKAGVECLPVGSVVVSDPSQYQDLLNYLGDKLLAPLRDQLQGKKQLIISPDGPLALVPWDLLRLQGRPLAASYDIHQVQSLSIYKLIKQRQAEYRNDATRQGLLAFGDPAYGQQAPSGANPRSPLVRGSGDDPAQALAKLKWPDLRYAGQEMQRAQGLFKAQGAKVVSREQASEVTLRALSRQGELAKYRYLLFSAHGYFDPNLPQFSSLVLRREGPEPERDGYVTIGEWVGMAFKSDLTLLSACNTALGRNVSGEGLLGLGYALYIAGNANTVLTLWPVNDQATAEFVSRFLAKVRDGQPHPQALADTKREFMNHKDPQLRSPYYWAPFVLYGG